MSDIFIHNTTYLSCLARYNTERRPVIRQYFDSRLRKNRINTQETSIDEVRAFAAQKKPAVEEDDFGFDEIFQEILLTLPEDINPQDYQGYLLFRYSHLEQSLEEKGEFAVYDLLSFEALLRDRILEETGLILSDLHLSEDKEEYVDFSSIEEPSDQFRQKWCERITLDAQQILNEFVEGTLPDDPTFDPELIEERIGIGQSILEFLSSPAEGDAEMDFFSNPLFQASEAGSEVIVPFPEVLLTTAQYRIEEYIGQFEDIQEIENQEKGDVVEGLAQDLLERIPSRNFVREFQYIHDPHPGEADGVLFFDNSYWAVEVKSHPIFRKIPGQTELIKDRYAEKVTQAIGQTRRAEDYLDSLDDEFGLIYNLTGNKNPDSMDSGGIIILDGFIPTLFSGNERADRELGVGQIHQQISEDERLVVITLYDLYQLLQEDEIEQFNEFLLWRTGYGEKFPIWGYNEREYWAFYFDNYLDDDEWEEGLETAVDKEIITFYISERFNDKHHLQNLVD